MLRAALALVVLVLVLSSDGVKHPADWPATANESCHSPTPSGHTVDVDNATHAQCAAVCAAKACGCFDMTAAGSCRGTAQFWGFHASHDRTAYTNATAPPPRLQLSQL